MAIDFAYEKMIEDELERLASSFDAMPYWSVYSKDEVAKCIRIWKETAKIRHSPWKVVDEGNGAFTATKPIVTKNK